jgi:pimeloyl-ACP methyl ester carboxylesterase
VSVLGLGFGGWVAAEMAAMGPDLVRNLVLVNPMGIQPRREYILDQFLISTEAYARSGFANDENFEAVYGAEPEFERLESWETDREMASRLAWKPYMYDPSLPRLLAGVSAPALVVRGDADRIVPAECADLYSAALPNARVETLPGGHAVDMEQPERLGALIAEFLR